MKTILLVFFFTGIFGFSNGYSQQADQNWPEVCKFQLSHSGPVVQLLWLANAEPKGFYYEIERSEDGTNFKTVGIVLGGLEQKGRYSYKFQEKATAAKIYYRIKQVKQDGSFRIAAERSV
jgi:hypothetical protein